MTPTRIVSTYLSQKPAYGAEGWVVGVAAALAGAWVLGPGAFAWLSDGSGSWAGVAQNGEWWRLVSMLFTHRDVGHLVGNLFVLLPFLFALIAYFGAASVLPLALVSGTLANFATLAAMPERARLLGVSGLSYWAVSAWLVLFLLIETRMKLRRRWAYALFLSCVLLAPGEYVPGVSHLNHFAGAALGVASGGAIYALHRSKIAAAETSEPEEPEEADPWVPSSPWELSGGGEGQWTATDASSFEEAAPGRAMAAERGPA